MADKREKITLTSTSELLIELDPDTNGYSKMIISRVGISLHEDTTQWSPETITELQPYLGRESSIFNYNIYIKNLNASVTNPITLAITRL